MFCKVPGTKYQKERKENLRVKKKEVLKRYSIKVGLALFEPDGSLPKVQT